ncbi:MAG: ABC transporter substrate-binding protein [Crocinitomicaceae bacterium]|nr:ABC transporter substrate-binding protein [Crocinitomicaceae bacterium]
MKVFIFFTSIFILLACEETSIDTKKNVPTGRSITDYASHFELIEFGENHLLHFMNPESGEIELRFLLSSDINVSKKGYTNITTPTSKLITLSGTSIGMLSKIKMTDQVVGVSNKNYIYNPSIIKRLNSGDVIEVGEESNLPLETIIQVKPEIILYSGFGSEYPGSKKLKSLNILSIPIYDWRETHPLGKAEWIKLFGALTNRKKEADAYFSAVESSYFELKEKATQLNSNPTVMSGNLLGDTWYTPNGDSFVAQMIKDAHADYKYKHTHGTGSHQLSLEEIIKDNSKTEYWINPGLPTKDEILRANEKLKYIHPINRGTYCYSKNSNRFWELSAIEPHHVLSDFIKIFHPDSAITDSLYFYDLVK